MGPPDAVREIACQLREAGLIVEPPFGPYLGWADLIVFSGKEIHPEGITSYRERGILSSLANHWRFLVWNSVPGPGPADFEHSVTSAGELVAVVLQFFLGEPLLIEGWVVPTHRHLEWSESHLRLAMAQAHPLSHSAWTQVSHRAREHYNRLLGESHLGLTNHPRSVSWNEWYQCLFVSLVRRPLADHERLSHEETLWIRRDLREAYLVQEPSAPVEE